MDNICEVARCAGWNVQGTFRARMNRITVYQDPKNEVLLKGLDLLMSNSESSAAELLSLVEAEEEKEKKVKRVKSQPAGKSGFHG